MNVYVIASSELGPVKIGMGKNPRKRLASLQTGNPISLDVFHIEPVGYIAAAVEREAHRILASTRRSDGGQEWFNITTAEARIVVRSVARAFEFVSDQSKTLHELYAGAARLWLKLHEEYYYYCFDNDIDQSDNIEKLDPPCGVRLLAETVPPSSSLYPSFTDFLMSHQDGMLMRWAFGRIVEPWPRDIKLKQFYLAASYLEKQGIGASLDSFYSFKDPAIRWFEWSTARELTNSELCLLQSIWNQFVNTHNSTIVKGQKWPNPPLSQSDNSVSVKILARHKESGDASSIMFASDRFRAVITTRHYVDYTGCDSTGWNFAVFDQKLMEFKTDSLRGFVASHITSDVWEQPFIPWLRSAPKKRDAYFAKFLSSPESCFPMPYHWDGPRQPYIICNVMPHVDVEGELR